jgi:hypothetical protein
VGMCRTSGLQVTPKASRYIVALQSAGVSMAGEAAGVLSIIRRRVTHKMYIVKSASDALFRYGGWRRKHLDGRDVENCPNLPAGGHEL